MKVTGLCGCGVVIWFLAGPVQDFIDRAGPEVLQRDLEKKTEYVLKLRPSETQELLYTTYLKGKTDFGERKELFTDHEVGCRGGQ
jgi:hypothetical protein